MLDDRSQQNYPSLPDTDMEPMHGDESPCEQGKQRGAACHLPSNLHTLTYTNILRRFAAKRIQRQFGLPRARRPAQELKP